MIMSRTQHQDCWGEGANVCLVCSQEKQAQRIKELEAAEVSRLKREEEAAAAAAAAAEEAKKAAGSKLEELESSIEGVQQEVATVDAKIEATAQVASEAKV